jgi:hypothetical protein
MIDVLALSTSNTPGSHRFGLLFIGVPTRPNLVVGDWSPTTPPGLIYERSEEGNPPLEPIL